MAWTVVDSPIGGLGVTSDAESVHDVSFGAKGVPNPVLLDPAADDELVLADAVAQLRAYLAGELTEFTVPVRMVGGSDFERSVWSAIAAIPYGRTRTYGEIARDVGEPGAAQAVGLACNHNPVPVIVPCHRVVGANGKLVGFGGGLPRKRWLLSLEARVHIEQTFAG
jgi:methylated-DNA-[protein]-cysteine S-methyltransferase